MAGGAVTQIAWRHTPQNGKLAAAQGNVAFHVHKAGDALPAAVIDALYAQKLAWFNQRHDVGAFTIPTMKDFLHELAAYAAQQHQLYLAWLTCGDSIAACHMGFVREGILHLYLTTYDAAYCEFSPGNAMMVETIKWAADHNISEVDFMRGDESYKERFATGYRDLSDFTMAYSWVSRILLIIRNRRHAY